MNANPANMHVQTESACTTTNKRADVGSKEQPLTNVHKKLLSSHLLKVTIEVNPLITATLQQLAITIFRGKVLDGFIKMKFLSNTLKKILNVRLF